MTVQLLSPPCLTSSSLDITWNLLPEDYPIPDDPVDNRTQPLLAAALSDSLSSVKGLPLDSITCTNYPVCATVNDQTVLKAPDWMYVAQITVPKTEVNRSYTPYEQGDIPAIVMEFLSHKEGGEYSVKPTYPPGKWFFYETILKVPYYTIFEPESGELEVYTLDESDRYTLQTPNHAGRYWIEPMQLFLGIWQGNWRDRSGYWLRWWDDQDNLLLFDSERAEQEHRRAEQERQRAEQEYQRAEQEHQRAEQERLRSERLLAQLRAAGLEPDI